MRYGIGPRRRRVPDPAEEAAEAENWLADYRASSEDSGDEFPSPRRRRDSDPDDPFANDGGEPAVPAPLFTDPPPGTDGPMPFGGSNGGGRVSPNFDEPTGGFTARPAFDEPTGDFNAPSADGFGGPRDEPPGSFGGRGVTPSYDEPTGSFGAPPRDEPPGGGNGFNPPPLGAFGPPAGEPTGGFNGFVPPPRDEPTGGFDAPSAGTFGGPRDEPTGSFGGRGVTPSYDEPTGSFGGRAVTPSYDEPTGTFRTPPGDEPTGTFGTPPRDEPTPAESGSPFGGGSGSGTAPPRRPPVASPHADEEPIFKPFDPSAAPVVPASPPPEEPILKYMSPRERTGTRSTYGGRRRAPEQRSAAVSGPPSTGPMTGPVTPAPVTSPPGTAGGRRRRYRDDEEHTSTGSPAGFAPEYQQPYPAQPAGYAESGPRPGFADQPRTGYPDQPRTGYPEPSGYAEPPARPGRLELPSQPTYAEPAGYVEPPGYAEPAAYAEPPGYAEPAPYAQPPAYAEPPGYVEPPVYPGNQGYAEPDHHPDAPPYDDPRQRGFRREDDYGPYPAERPFAGEPQPGEYPVAAAYSAPARQPELPPAPARTRRSDAPPERPPSLPPVETMRTVVPDTTGDMPRVSASTTGGIPRVGSGNAGTTGRVAAVGSATTGSIPRISPGTTGSLRPVRIDPVRPAPRRTSRWTVALAVVGVVVLVAVCGLSTWFVFQDELSGNKGNNTAGPADTPTARDISTRDADPEPLTEAEVFPLEVIAGQTGNQYTILKKETSTDCGKAATDDLVKLLADNGCSQVVRGTMKSADGVYLITAGIFNLKDVTAANSTHENIEPTVKAQKGRFTGLLAGAGTEVLVRAPMVLGWHARGHYLAYSVIARADGQGFDQDTEAQREQIQADILSTHLRDAIIGGRTQPNRGGASPGASGAPSPSQS